MTAPLRPTAPSARSATGRALPPLARNAAALRSAAALPRLASQPLPSMTSLCCYRAAMQVVLSLPAKHFFFEVRSNERGTYLKIKEVCGSLKNLLVLPLGSVPLFQQAISRAVAQHEEAEAAAAGAGAAGHRGGGGMAGGLAQQQQQ